MNVQKLTLKSQEALQTAQEIASSYNNQALEPIHLLAALAQDTAGIVPSMLLKLGANTTILKIKINEALEHLPKVSGLTQHYLSNDLNAVFDEALKEANALKDEYIAAEHILIALSESRNPAGQLLRDQNVRKDTILRILSEFRGSQRVTNQNAEDSYQALRRYGRILNEEVRSGKLDPVIGREDEVRRVLQVLSRRTKNILYSWVNPALVKQLL